MTAPAAAAGRGAGLHCSDCGEDHTGHHDQTRMSRNGAGLSVTVCDGRTGRSFGSAGGIVRKQDRRAAEDYYRASRLHHENVCMANGDGYIDPRDTTRDAATGSAAGTSAQLADIEEAPARG